MSTLMLWARNISVRCLVLFLLFPWFHLQFRPPHPRRRLVPLANPLLNRNRRSRVSPARTKSTSPGRFIYIIALNLLTDHDAPLLLSLVIRWHYHYDGR